MRALIRVVKTFPSAQLSSHSGGLPVEVSLIAQLGHGSGNHLYESVVARQRAHELFVDELEEPSARLGGIDLSKGDPTSLYSFVVGANGHPFHRHAGHRVFTAVSGSGGAQLRFSSASPAQIALQPERFIDALRFVNIPPDCLFTVRFGGDTWHQFAPLQKGSRHPAFFALSCHTNELGGDLPDSVRERVMANAATIPSLTELLPQSVLDLLRSPHYNASKVATIAFSLDAPEGTMQGLFCRLVRGSAGILRGLWSRWRGSTGFLTGQIEARTVQQLELTPSSSLLLDQFTAQHIHHDDTFSMRIGFAEIDTHSASCLLAGLLEGFQKNPPVGVSRMMAIRNTLVRPLGLRTSPLGCPVSSLLSAKDDRLFAGKYPVLEQSVNTDDSHAQVLLGADDKHLSFRSCVSVAFADGHVEFTLGTRVHCRNLFGRFYMAAIDRTHRSYVTPTMMQLAADYALRSNARKQMIATPVIATPSSA